MSTAPDPADTKSSGAVATGDDARATQLATTALKLFSAGQSDGAARALREAISLSPQNSTVLAAFHEIQKSQDAPAAVVGRCSKLVEQGDEKSGTEALRLLNEGIELSSQSARQLVDILLAEGKVGKHLELRGKLLGLVLKNSQDARISLAESIQTQGMSKVYQSVSCMGENALDALVTVTLDEKSWNNAKDQKKAELYTELFKLFSRDLDGRPSDIIRALSRLLSTKADNLQSSVDSATLAKLLNLLSLSNPAQTRTPALLAVAKYMETIDAEKAQKLLSDFVTEKLVSNTEGDLECAFSSAAALFPVVTSIASPLFLTDGFLPSILPVLEKRGQKVQQAGLELLSSACVDKACREAISKYCVAYLESLVKNSAQGKEIAALVLAKISGASDETAANDAAEKPKPTAAEAEKLADVFKNMMLKGDESSRQNSVEGLAYTSLTPAVKEKLIKDKAFLKGLIKNLGPSTNTTYLFGSLTTLYNLSHYTKPLSEEQKKMAQLKNYANAQPKAKEADIDPLDKDASVRSRCLILVDAGVVPALVNIGKKISPTAILLICNILVSLSKAQQTRGLIAQQGGVKLLIQLHTSVASSTTASSRTVQEKKILHTAAYALARILISVNPSLVFGASSLPLSSAISPLLTLIQTVHASEDNYRDLLPIFEALLGLTNLASTTNPTREIIIRLGWPIIEELLLADNDMIQRADTELICNLMISPEGVAKFADGSKQAANRLHILLALADADDVATRRAAGGAIAMLTEWDSAVEAIVKRDRGVEIMMQMAAEENEELMHRGVVAIRNIVLMGGDAAVKLATDENGEEVFKDILQRTKREAILVPAVEVLKKLLE